MRRKATLELLGLLVIVGTAAYLRLVNLAGNPGWYSDEAAHIDIARHLLLGRVQYMAINQSTLLFARPPLFQLLLAGVFRVFGVDIGTLRAFTGLLGVLTVGLLYGVVRRIQGDAALALLAALGLAIYPQAVLYSRFGFSYNLLSPLMLLVLLGLWEYAQNNRRGGLALAGLALGIGLTSDLMMGSFILPLALVVLARRWRDLLWVLPLIALPFALYATAMLLSAPDAFLFDLRFTLFRLNKLSLADQIANVGLNYTVLISQDFWMLSGVIGLFLLPQSRFRPLALGMFLLPVVEMGRTVALYSLSGLLPDPAAAAGGAGDGGAVQVWCAVCGAGGGRRNQET